MDPGELRQRGRLQAMTPTSDEGGGRAEDWADVATVWAAIEALGGSEQLRAMGVGVTEPHRVVIRYRAGVTSANQFIEEHPEGDRTHEITSVRDLDGHRAYLELLTEWKP